MHGKGEYVWEDGIRYEGDFTLNHITGKGFYRWTDGRQVYTTILIRGGPRIFSRGGRGWAVFLRKNRN